VKSRESLLSSIEALKKELKNTTEFGTSYYYHVSNLLSSYKRDLEELDTIELYGINAHLVKEVVYKSHIIASIVEVEGYGQFLLQDGKLTQLHHTGEPNELT
jgi:hypothetical protein